MSDSIQSRDVTPTERNPDPPPTGELTDAEFCDALASELKFEYSTKRGVELTLRGEHLAWGDEVIGVAYCAMTVFEDDCSIDRWHRLRDELRNNARAILNGRK